MQITVVHGSDPTIFGGNLFPETPIEAKSWIQNQFNQGVNLLTQAGMVFRQKAEELYNRLNDPALEARARAFYRKAKGLCHPNAIIAFDTIPQIQAAKPLMQRYIMAEPEIRDLYHRQLCDGYSDSYVDYEPGKIGEDHYDWRRVMNGIIRDIDDDSKDSKPWKAVMYCEDLHEGDMELQIDQQASILAVHDLVRQAIFGKTDPTDIFNGDIGG